MLVLVLTPILALIRILILMMLKMAIMMMMILGAARGRTCAGGGALQGGAQGSLSIIYTIILYNVRICLCICIYIYIIYKDVDRIRVSADFYFSVEIIKTQELAKCCGFLFSANGNANGNANGMFFANGIPFEKGIWSGCFEWNRARTTGRCSNPHED